MKGVKAATVLVQMVISDLSANPFNGDISTGDPTYKVRTGIRARLESALKRLSSIISIESITEKVDADGNTEYVIKFQDLESREPGEVSYGQRS